jgi:NADPH:quinone reductase-like Zn-dependent oxidoreductase
MTQMNAAVVTSFDEPPHYQPYTLPDPARDAEASDAEASDAEASEQIEVEVLAAGLHPRVRTGARGAHYSSTGTLPMVPGVDAVGRKADGTLVYFVADDAALGTMAERALVDPRRAVELPADADVAKIAAAMNPAMSSWVALRRRVALEPGQSVLVLGATGNAGGMAIQIARLLGAGQVIAAGRDPERLAATQALGADITVRLDDDEPAGTADDLAAAAAEVDIVIDYLWGAPAQLAIPALLTARADRSRALDWVQIGAIAGPTLELPSAALRSANLRIQGSGQGSVSPRAYRAELPSLVEAIDAGTIAVRVREAPLADVEQVWLTPEVPGERTVLIP